jgi:CarboxypepD_reg-like domain
MKTLPLFVISLFLCLQFYGQTITGNVFDASTGEPLIYASIGVIETSVGTITSEKGNFKLEVKNLPNKSIVRFSMIGFKAKTFTIEELANKENTIRLDNETYKLPEVIVSPGGKLKKVGTTSFSLKSICGWGGTDFGKGWEIGTKIDLGDTPKRLKSLHIRVYKQSYDSSLFRLHIRNIVDNLPANELLKTNILVSISKETGWMTIDLSNYNLVFEGEIALSLEWIKIAGIDLNKLITANGNKQRFPAVTFNVKQKEGLTFTKWGTEAKWVIQDNNSPSIYLMVQ